MKRRIWAAVLALSVMLAGLPASAAAAKNEVIRSNNFELTDSDFKSVKTGSDVTSALLDSKSSSKMSIKEFNKSRCVSCVTKENEKGGIGFPFDEKWTPVAANMLTLEASFVFRDSNSDYELQILSSDWSVTDNLVTFAKDGKIYARSSADMDANMAARAEWKRNKLYHVRLVCHLDTMSYDFYLLETVRKIKLVENEPMQNSASAFKQGAAGFYCMVPELPHGETEVLVDDILLSKSDEEGKEPVVNPNPGEIRQTESLYADPVSYYVSPNGNDSNDGKSPQRPFRSPQVAADHTAPGDTVYFMDGVYTYEGTDRFVKIKNSGAPGAYITYTAYEGAHPVFKAYSGWDHFLVCGSYIKIENLTVEGTSSEDRIPEGEAIYEEVARLTDSGGAIDWGKVSKTNTTGISVGGRDAIKEGFPVTHHVEVRGCTIHNCPGGGLLAAAGDYITFEDNEVYNNCWTNIYASSGISILGMQDVDNNTSNYKVIIRNNRVYNNITHVKWLSIRNYSDGNGIIIDSTLSSDYGPDPYGGRILVANNLSYGNGGSGIHSFRSAHVDIVNNVVYNNSANPNLTTYAQLFSSQSTDVRVINNIIYGRPGKPLASGDNVETVLFANNLYYNGELSGKMKLSNNIEGDPKFVDLNNYDFHLTEDSPAIDQGLLNLSPETDHEGNARPQGAGYDIGAYESGYTSSHPLIDNTLEVDELVKPKEFNPSKAECAYGTPTIDGEIDDVWNNAQKLRVEKVVSNQTQGGNATGIVRTMWDENNLYILAEISDNLLSAVNQDDDWQQDSVELFIDENNARTGTHDEDDGQFRVNFENKVSGGYTTDLKRLKSAAKKVDGGYLIEASIAWTVINPMEDVKVGFDVQINDDMGGGQRAAVVIWCDPNASGYSTSLQFGELTLVKKISSEYAPEDDQEPETQPEDDSGIKIILDGKELKGDTPPQNINDRVLVPMRLIFEALGAEVSWEKETMTATGVKDGKTVALQIDNTNAEVDGSTIELDVPAMLINGRTMVPVRFISESLDAKVDWDGDNQTVIINTNN